MQLGNPLDATLDSGFDAPASEAVHAPHPGTHASTPAQAAQGTQARPISRSENISYLAGVDQLRCLAALLVVYYHGVQMFSSSTRYHAPFDPAHWLAAPDPFSALIVEGHTAVSLFMVLSGFIFAFGAESRRVAYREFLINRFLRTYPLFLFLVMVGMAVHFRSVSFSSLAQTLLGGANFWNAEKLGAFSTMFWSLGVEWQFYLLFPALMALLNRDGARRLLLLGALVVGARGLGYLQGLDVVNGLYWQLLGRIDQFMCGMIAGWLYARYRSHVVWQDIFPPAVASVLIGAMAFNLLGGWPAVSWLRLLTPTLEGVAWAALVVGYVAVVERGRFAQTLLARAISAIGATSYSIYLWHFVFIEVQIDNAWVPDWLSQPELNAALVLSLTTVPALLAFSALSYHAVELPFLKMRKRYLRSEPGAQVAAGAALAS